MPRGDGTGPMGAWPMTGRGAGYCAGSVAPGYWKAAPWCGDARGFGRGRGFGGGGRGWRHLYSATGRPDWMRFGGSAAPDARFDPEMERKTLKDQAETLQAELDFIKKRLSEIEERAE